MKWINCSERMPENKQGWYMFRQIGNMRSAYVLWLDDMSHPLFRMEIPIEDIEWLDESDPEILFTIQDMEKCFEESRRIYPNGIKQYNSFSQLMEFEFNINL